MVYDSQGKYEEALEIHSKSLDIKTRILGGNNHLDVAASKYNIASLKETQGDLEGARRLFLECEQIYAKVLGADHEETLDAAMRALTVCEEEEDEEGEEGDSDQGEEEDQSGDSGER
jgi:tetratricopeptide (TPR) repeat protein